MTKITIVAVHPTVTIIRTPSGQTEVPTEWFPETPKVDQEWSLNVQHTTTDTEKLSKLNDYLARD